KKRTPPHIPEFANGQYAHWDIAANIGRRYAAVAGDYNPIHLSTPSARLFGFASAIATGMWLQARIAAQLAPKLEQSAYQLSVAFKKPVFLPSPVTFSYALSKTGGQFVLTDAEREILHLQGDVSYF